MRPCAQSIGIGQCKPVTAIPDVYVENRDAGGRARRYADQPVLPPEPPGLHRIAARHQEAAPQGRRLVSVAWEYREPLLDERERLGQGHVCLPRAATPLIFGLRIGTSHLRFRCGFTNW